MEATMLTNTLLLYMTQEALTKARRRLQGRKPTDETATHTTGTATPVRRAIRRSTLKVQETLRH
jgi:hypothetical protein